MIRKAVIVLLMLGAIGTAVLSADSYRVRKPDPRLPGKQPICGMALLPSAGFEVHYFLDDRRHAFVGVHKGTLALSYLSFVEPGVLVRPIDIQFGRFRFKQRTWSTVASWGPCRPGNYRVREPTSPLWLPLVLFATYPTIALIRGPVRRYRRRRRGLCIRCGYNLTGNISGVCPECGTEIKKSCLGSS